MTKRTNNIEAVDSRQMDTRTSMGRTQRWNRTLCHYCVGFVLHLMWCLYPIVMVGLNHLTTNTSQYGRVCRISERWHGLPLYPSIPPGAQWSKVDHSKKTKYANSL